MSKNGIYACQNVVETWWKHGDMILCLGIPKVTSFSRMCISVAVNGSSSSMESVLNVGLYFDKNGFL